MGIPLTRLANALAVRSAASLSRKRGENKKALLFCDTGRVRGCLLALLFCLLFLPFSTAHAKPSRIVSVNLCIDQLVLELADAKNIAGISFNSHNPSMSLHYKKAREHTPVRASVEDIMQLKPDLVLLGYGTYGMKTLLERQGVTVKELGMANSFADIESQVKQVASWVGEEEKGKQKIAAMQQNLNSAAKMYDSTLQKPRVGVYYTNGYTDGTGTLMHEVIEQAGGENMGAELGIKNIGYLPMEVLVKQPPELLIVNDYENNYPSLGQQMLSHPALKKATMEHTMKISGRRLSCATPDYALVVKEIATRLHKAVR